MFGASNGGGTDHENDPKAAKEKSELAASLDEQNMTDPDGVSGASGRYEMLDGSEEPNDDSVGGVFSEKTEMLYEKNQYLEKVSSKYRLIQIVLSGFLAVFVLVSMIVRSEDITYENLFYLFKDFDTVSGSQGANFSTLVYGANSNQSFSDYRGGLAVVSSESLTVFTATGRQALDVSLSYASPRLLTSDKYLLVYGQGEDRFSIYNSFARLRSFTVDGEIRCSALADNGCFAVSYVDQTYASVISVYQSSLQLKMQFWKNSYVTAMCFDRSGKYLTVASTEARGGKFITVLETFAVGDDKVIQSFEVENDVCSEIAYFYNDWLLFCGLDRWVLWDSEGTKVREGSMSSPESLYVSEYGFAYLSGEVLRIFDEEGGLIGERVASDKTKEVYVGKDEVLMLIENNLYRFNRLDGSGSVQSFDFQISDLLCYGMGRVLLCSRSKARYIKF